MLGNLVRYLDSVVARDPAPRSRWEVLLYPGVWALFFHKIAHRLFRADLFFLARVVNHVSRFLTAIDIHPGATIGRNFFIDHGFTVIGETAHIGDNVTIYQCVTLGGSNPTNGKGGKRHPTLLDNVIVGSGAQIIGPVTVGKRARVGASAVVTEDVPEGATMIGVKARSTLVKAETYAKEFMPYGTPCKEPCEPVGSQRVDELEEQVAALRAQVDSLMRKLEEEKRAEPVVKGV
ncbi:MAG: serine acetyltransferase [Novosphingobium lindaniclasticum]|jgi:serine O-acetyltransferase|uniref:Serine acetyltransferase n=1 Tax=Novosphingobium lindaniclasticum LE124 TaxID=1096930 RepID=T0H6T9_9SPHN|nr:serine O-acetyltransferase EpsC [Novosphingobium lindaniclasticum]EQB12041.1 serine O-acetyltransferase [Novosphingobium lindaniclasticum LE124]MDF2638427.1 serine acetyltransferase [Novosphingobium lindaniclasticum]